MKRYELVDGGSSKFWEIEAKDTKLTVRFGRIGTKGQTQEKSFGSADAATAERDKLIREKTKKGYKAVECEPTEQSGADEQVAEVKLPTEKKKKAAAPPVDESGWLDTGTGYRLALEDGKIRCKNAKGQMLSAAPKDVKETSCYEELDNLREFLANHERDCLETVETWMLRSLPVPASVLMSVWGDPAWRRALENAVVVPAGAPAEGGFFRGVDASRGIGVVDRDGETRWLTLDTVEIPHPIWLEALDDVRALSTELSLQQGIPQLFREVYDKPRACDVSETAVNSFAGGEFKQLNHALSACRKHGFRVSGGSAICKVWELDERGKLCAQEARFWIGSDDPMAEAETGDLIWVDERECSLPLARVGRVAYSEGVRMASAIYSARVVEKEAQSG